MNKYKTLFNNKDNVWEVFLSRNNKNVPEEIIYRGESCEDCKQWIKTKKENPDRDYEKWCKIILKK
jgi:hypothetical protein